MSCMSNSSFSDLRLAFIPLDDRPCCWQLAKHLAQAVDLGLELPPDEFWRGGDKRCEGVVNVFSEKLTAWVAERFEEGVQALVASVDSLIYGGLTASRCPGKLEAAVPLWDDFCEKLKDRRLYLFSTVMRIAPTQHTAQEVEQAGLLAAYSTWYCSNYRADDSDEAFLTVSCEEPVHMYNSRSPLEQRAQDFARTHGFSCGLDPAFLHRYFNYRARKHLFNKHVLNSWLATCNQGGYLAFCLDDSQSHGFNVLEAQELVELLTSKEDGILQLVAEPYAERGRLAEIDDAFSNVSVGVGTDETALLMLARAVNHQADAAVHWSYEGAQEQVGIYEGQPLKNVLESQARWARLNLTNPDDSDSSVAQIFIYAPWHRQKEAAEQDGSADLQGREWGGWTLAITQALECGQRVFLADLAYANGGSTKLAEWLLDNGLIGRLSGYAAWNTAGNSLGTVIAWAALDACHPQRVDDETILSAKDRCLLERFLDDYCYQAVIRPKLSKEIGGTFVVLAEEDAEAVAARIELELEPFWQRLLNGWPRETVWHHFKVKLPWRRLFEIELELY